MSLTPDAKQHLLYLEECVLTRLKELQNKDGSFTCFQKILIEENVPWTESVPIPFITASVLCSLKNSKHRVAAEIAEKGYKYLISLQEFGGLWRYWKHSELVDCVPPDADDTCLSSFFIRHYQKSELDNIKWVEDNRNEEGMLLTWFTPAERWKKYPALLDELKKDEPNYRETINHGYLHPDDWEVAVMANILLYLGENEKTAATINYTLEVLLNNKPFERQYYKDKLITWYHVARAFANSVPAFDVLKEPANRELYPLLNSEPKKNEQHKSLLAALSLTHFGVDISESVFYKVLMDENRIPELESIFTYYNSKDNVFNAGASSLPLAWYVEYLEIEIARS